MTPWWIMKAVAGLKPGLFAAILLLGPAIVSANAADNELQRTWDRALVYAPAAGAAGYSRLSIRRLAALSGGPSPRAVVLYAHGCDGLSEISRASARFLARAGYLVIAPNSFARRNKPVSCRALRHKGGMHRAVLGWRQAEIRFAYSKLRQLRLPGRTPVILMGHSEGAIAVATVTGIRAAGRIVEGWTCHAGWPEYRGLASGRGEPVLALVGADDPWFSDPVLKGDCGAFMAGRPAARSVVVKPPNYLSRRHWLSSDPAIQRTILSFIRDATNVAGRRNASR